MSSDTFPSDNDFVDLGDKTYVESGGVSDELLSALTQNLQIIYDGITFDLQSLPEGIVGVSLASMSSGEKGKAKFDLDGTEYITTVNATEEISEGQGIKVSGSDNDVVGLSPSQSDNSDSYPKERVIGDVVSESVNANEGIFADPLEPTRGGTTLRLFVVLGSKGVLSADVSKAGYSYSTDFNAGNSLDADSSYNFDMTFPPDSDIQISVDTGMTVKQLTAKEIIEGSTF